jgi:hypothetical protein
MRNSKIHSYANLPAFSELFGAYLPAYPAVAALAVLIACALFAKSPVFQAAMTSKPYLALPILWAGIPPLVLFAISYLTPAKVFVPRYILPYAPASALCFALVLGSLRAPLAGRVAMMLLAGMAGLILCKTSSFRQTDSRGDWGSALQFIERDTAADRAPVLIRSQFIESDHLPVTTVVDSPLFTPLAYYQTDARFIPLPIFLRERTMAFLHGLLREELQGRRFLLAETEVGGADSGYIEFLRGALGPSWRVRTRGDFDDFVVTEFAPGQ